MADNQERGLVAFQAQPAGGAPAADFGSVDVRSGFSEAATQLAQHFSGMSDRIGALPITRRHARAPRPVARRARSRVPPDARRHDPCRSFDDAGMETYRSQLAVRHDEDFETAYKANPNSPAALDKSLAEKRRACWPTATRVPSRRRAGLRHLRLTYMREAARGQEKLANYDLENRDRRRRHAPARLSQKAFLLGLDPAADAVLAQDTEDLAKRLGVRGADGQPVIGAEAAQRCSATRQPPVARGRYLGAFERLTDVPGKQAFIKKLRDDFAAGKARPRTSTCSISASSRRLIAEMRAARAVRKHRQPHTEIERRGRAQDGKAGITPKQDDLAALRTQVAASGSPELQRCSPPPSRWPRRTGWRRAPPCPTSRARSRSSTAASTRVVVPRPRSTG